MQKDLVSNKGRYRNMFNRVKQLAKKEYYSELVNLHKNNAKKLWSVVNDLAAKLQDKTSVIDVVMQNGVKLEDPVSIGNAFNEHFSIAGSKALA